MKKHSWGILLAAAMMGLTGCGGPDLNEKQTSEAAEYMAGLILKYDLGYTDTLIYPESTEEPGTTGEPSATEMASASAAPDAQKGDSISAQGQGDKTSDDTEVAFGDFAKVLGLKDVKVSFRTSSIVKEYSSKNESSYVVYAPKGKRLAVITLEMKNTAKQDKKIYLTEKGAEYRLNLADGTSATAEITAISNDLNFLNTKIKAGKRSATVLLFTVPDTTKSLSGELTVSVGEQTATMKVK